MWEEKAPWCLKSKMFCCADQNLKGPPTLYGRVCLNRDTNYCHSGLDLLVQIFLFSCIQNFLRDQNNKTNYNLVCETLQFLDCICGSTTGGLGLLGLYINESNVNLVKQTLETITEYCQGPCHENQVLKWHPFWKMGTYLVPHGKLNPRVTFYSSSTWIIMYYYLN